MELWSETPHSILHHRVQWKSRHISQKKKLRSSIELVLQLLAQAFLTFLIETIILQLWLHKMWNEQHYLRWIWFNSTTRNAETRNRYFDQMHLPPAEWKTREEAKRKTWNDLFANSQTYIPNPSSFGSVSTIHAGLFKKEAEVNSQILLVNFTLFCKQRK